VFTIDEQGMIAGIQSGPAPDGSEQIDGAVLPGMVDVHSHIHQRLIAGLTGRRGAGDDSFWSWREQMYAAVAMLDGDAFQALAAHGFMELLEGGYTTIGEFHYPHRIGGQPPFETAGRILQGAKMAGCGLTLLPVWYQHGGFGRQPLGERQQPFGLSLDELVELIERLLDAGGSSLTRVGVAPHSLRAVDVADLPMLLDRIPEGPVHLHISEQPAEVEACFEHHGCRPIELLQSHVELDERWCLIHATHANDHEVELLAQSEAVVGICPTTEADLGDGLFPVYEYLKGGGHAAIGSDSNLVVSAAEELRLLEWGQRLRLHQRNVLCQPESNIATELWQQAARSGARALQQPVGELAVGRRADLVVLSDTHPLLAGLPAAEQLDAFVFAHAPDMIGEVRVGGEARVREGRHRARDALAPTISTLRQRLAEQRV
jgi:formimidoylglutamate deiminase